MTKRCTNCKIEKPFSEFYLRGGNREDYQSRCKECERQRKREDKRRPEVRNKNNEKRRNRRKEDSEYAARDRARSNKYYQENPELVRAIGLAGRYNLDKEVVYQYLLERKSDTVCDICQRECPTGKSLALDHDHETNEIRGLLCGNCNKALGLFNDSIKFMERAIGYLSRERS